MDPRIRHRCAHLPRRAFTLIEVCAVALAITALAIFILWPRVNHNRGDSRRFVCAANLKGIGTSMKLYANDNYDTWAAPGFDESAIGSIRYTVPVGSGEGTDRSPSRDQPSRSGEGGATELSLTRVYWMLVRSGDVTVNQFICPQGDDEPDPTENLEAYYDFAGNSHISYGFQVPFGPRATRAGEWMNNRVALAADKGPYKNAAVPTPPSGLDLNSAPKEWRPFNSVNHGGEGQNVLFADGHAMFHRTPVIGVDGDNIYTVALDNTDLSSRMMGESPWVRSAHPYLAPGQNASTDSVIFP